MNDIRLAFNKFLRRIGYRISRFDESEYSYREDLYKIVTDKYTPFIKGKILDVGAAPDSWAKKNLSKDNEIITFDKVGNVDVNGDLLHMPFEDKTFDCVLCFETIEHVQDPSSAIREISRVLKPDGVIVASTPFIYELHGEEYGDYWRITRQGWKYLLKDFKDVEVLWFGPESKPHHYLVKGLK